MIIETKAYQLLSKNEELNALMDEIRGGKFGNGYNQGIFTYEIPENPVSVAKKELAPFIRINPNYDAPVHYSDDEILSTEYRVVINFWCETAKQAEKIADAMDKIMESGGFERYTANEKPRYKDGDINLLMNIRKYRFFDWSTTKEKEE